MITHAWHWYWQQSEGNVVATPACAALAVAFTIVFRKPIAAWWRKHFGAQADLADIRKIAEDGRKIAADLFEHHTGRAHHLAPDDDKARSRM